MVPSDVNLMADVEGEPAQAAKLLNNFIEQDDGVNVYPLELGRTPAPLLPCFQNDMTRLLVSTGSFLVDRSSSAFIPLGESGGLKNADILPHDSPGFTLGRDCDTLLFVFPVIGEKYEVPAVFSPSPNLHTYTPVLPKFLLYAPDLYGG